MTPITWTLHTYQLAELTDYFKNPRSLSKVQFDQLKTSLDKFGIIDKPIVNLDPAHTVIGGHQRLHVLRAEGVKECECWIPSRLLTEREVEELNIRLNKNTGAWDFDVLANSWELPDLLEWGFNEKELQLGGFDMDQGEGDDPGAQVDKAEELREKWGAKLGDLWKLGEHRLICGDCTDRSVVVRVMGGEKASLCVTDPPYGVNYDPAWRGEDLDQTVHGEAIAGDNNFDWLAAFEHVPADVLYVWLASYWLATVQFGIEKFGFETRYLIIWNKDLAVFGRGNYHWKHEPCLYMVRKGAKMNWQGARDESTVWDIPTIHSFKNGHNSEEWGLVGHCNQKPLECMEHPIRNNSAEGETVIDLFSGSGTTLIACERLHRKCRAVEISPAYVAVAIQRWVDMTGGAPELITACISKDA